MSVVTRIAPSPTGQMHIGTVRTALYNYLFAKKHGGTYFVRIEDTDRERNKEEWVDAIWEDFGWCGLEPDARYRTSEMLERHKALLKDLVAKDKAYISKEPKKDDPTQTVEVVRLRNPNKPLSFEDLIRGTITFDTTELGDFVIARAIDDPLYHFAVVVDDGDAGVTHVLRAEEHLSNTPRQILILEALGYTRPAYAHLPLILAPDRSKLSKRKHGASVENYRAQGILPEAMINYLALLGWNPGGEREIYSLPELVEIFDIAKVHKAGAIFNEEKLLWFNHEYLRALPDADFLAKLAAFTTQEVDPRLVPLLKERAHTLKQAADLLQTEFAFLSAAQPTAELLLKGAKTDVAGAKENLTQVHEILSQLSDFGNESVKQAVFPYADQKGRASVLWPLRVALTGMEKSPDPFTSASLLGKEESLTRISSAIALL